MNRLLCALPLLALAPLAITPGLAANAQSATELGPTAIQSANDVGRVAAIVCSPTNPDLYFCAAADGGIWRYNGSVWSPLTDHMPTTAIGALALDPTNENIIYAGTGEANFANHSRYGLGIFKSTDGGDNWVHLGESSFGGRCISKIVVDPTNPQRVWAAVTTAGGFPAGTLPAAKGHPGAFGPVGVFKSEDGGVSWEQMPGGPTGLPNLSCTDLVMEPGNPQVLYAAVGQIFGIPPTPPFLNDVYKTTDGGATWTDLNVISNGDQNIVGRIALGIAPTNPQRVYALIAYRGNADGGGAGNLGARRSDNGGATWQVINSAPDQASYGWYLCTVGVSPTPADGSTVFMGGLTLTRSTNSGQGVFNVTPPHVDLHAVAFDASGRLLVGDDGGVHRSINLGNNWTAINAGLGSVQFYAGLSTHPTDSNIVFGGTQDNGTNRRPTGGGTIWTREIGGDGGWTQIDQANGQRFFGESQGTGNLVRSTDGGFNFSNASSGIISGDRNCFLPPFLIDPANSQRMIYATHRVYESLNGGTSWSPKSGDITAGGGAAIRAVAMGTDNPQAVYAATNDGRVLSSIDGGATFTLRLTGVDGWPRVTRELWVDPTDAATVYLAGARFGVDQVRRSTDFGATWETLDGDLPDIPVNVVVADVRCQPPTHTQSPILYAGTDAGVYRSVNDGVTWRRFSPAGSEGTPNACIIDLTLEPARQRLLVGTQGRGAWLVSIPLRSDFDGNGTVEVPDIFAFLAAWFGLEPRADFDEMMGHGVPDIFAFLSAWFGECP